jgi:hypothetical protein
VVRVHPFSITLRGVETKKINSRTKRITRLNSLKQILQYHLFFVCTCEKDRIGLLFVNVVGSIEFITEKNRLSFLTNKSALKQPADEPTPRRSIWLHQYDKKCTL